MQKKLIILIIFYLFISLEVFSAQFPFSVSHVSIWGKKDPRIRSLQATMALSRELLNFNPDFLKKRAVTILYTNGGDHLTPLDIANFFIHLDKIDRADFIITEKDKDKLLKIKENISELIREDFYQTGENSFYSEKINGERVEANMSLIFMGKPINISYIVNPQAKENFREKDLNKADIVYCHDAGSNYTQLYASILKGFKKARKELFFMGENLNETDFRRKLADDPATFEANIPRRFDLVSDVKVVRFGFGHRGHFNKTKEKGRYLYKSAMLLRFNGKILTGLTDEEYEMLTDLITVAGVKELNVKTSTLSGIENFLGGNKIYLLNDWVEKAREFILEKINKRLDGESRRKKDFVHALRGLESTIDTSIVEENLCKSVFE